MQPTSPVSALIRRLRVFRLTATAAGIFTPVASPRGLKSQLAMNRLSLLPFTLLFAMVGFSSPTETEPLRITYELSLNRCREHSCHAETASRSEVQVTLEEEEPNFLTNYVPIEVHVGSLAYQLRFNLRRVSKKNQIERTLTIGFSGRMGTLTGHQLTWGEKSFKHEMWSAFKMASVSGAAYSENGESVTPTLMVRDVEIIHR